MLTVDLGNAHSSVPTRRPKDAARKALCFAWEHLHVTWVPLIVQQYQPITKDQPFPTQSG